MKTFTDPFRIPCPLSRGNHGRSGGCCQCLPLRLSMRHTRPTGGRASTREHPTYVSACRRRSRRRSLALRPRVEPMPPSCPFRACSLGWRPAQAMPRPGATICGPAPHHVDAIDAREVSRSPQQRWYACAARGKPFSTTSRGAGCARQVRTQQRAWSRLRPTPPDARQPSAGEMRHMGGRETPATAKIRAELPLCGCPLHPGFCGFPALARRCGRLLCGRPGGAHPADRPPASIR